MSGYPNADADDYIAPEYPCFFFQGLDQFFTIDHKCTPLLPACRQSNDRYSARVSCGLSDKPGGYQSRFRGFDMDHAVSFLIKSADVLPDWKRCWTFTACRQFGYAAVPIHTFQDLRDMTGQRGACTVFPSVFNCKRHIE